jgi:hypothetical protein
MTAEEFRSLALDLPEASESAHMGHPDFRVRKKIFATLDAPDKGWGMVKLTPEQQEQLLLAAPDVFMPAAGAWGARGCTHVHLASARKKMVRSALVAAWRNVAPKRLAQEHEALE